VFEEIVQGGTPFEKGIQVDPRIGRKGSLYYTLYCIVIDLSHVSFSLVLDMSR